jgi:nitrous oxidase accessory protein NosD
MKRLISGIVVTLLLTCMLTLAFRIRQAKATTVIVPDDYSTIQQAVNAASPGDTVLVRSGTYHEHITINKTITIIGENPSNTIIDGDAVEYTPIMRINQSNVIVENLTIRNTASCNDTYGVLIYRAQNVGLFNVTVRETYRAIVLSNANYSLVSDSQISNNYAYAITLLPPCQFNNFTGNNIVSNPIGAWLAPSCTNSTFYHNNFINNLVQVDTTNYGNYTRWDNGYPSGGNYWSDYQEAYPDAAEIDSSGIWNMPYRMGGANDSYPLVNPYSWNSYNIGIASIDTSKTIIGQGHDMSINVIVFNYGNSTESFNVTAYANTTEIGTKETTLSPGNLADLTFDWDTAGFAYGSYTLWVYASPVLGETNTANNIFTYGTVKVTIPGDVNGDFRVNILDVVMITSIYGSKKGDPNFNPNCDLDGDGKITILDVVTCTSHYGQKWP